MSAARDDATLSAGAVASRAAGAVLAAEIVGALVHGVAALGSDRSGARHLGAGWKMRPVQLPFDDAGLVQLAPI